MVAAQAQRRTEVVTAKTGGVGEGHVEQLGEVQAGAHLAQMQQLAGDAVGATQLARRVEGQQTLQRRAENVQAMVQMYQQHLAKLGEQAVLDGAGSEHQRLQGIDRGRALPAAGVQHPDYAAVEAEDRRGQAGELAGLPQIVLLADEEHRLALGQGAARCRGADVLLGKLRADATHLAQLTGAGAAPAQTAEHHAFQIDAGQYPILRRQRRVQLLHLGHRAVQQQTVALGDLLATGHQWRLEQQLVALAQAVVLRALPGAGDYLGIDQMLARGGRCGRVAGSVHVICLTPGVSNWASPPQGHCLSSRQPHGETAPAPCSRTLVVIQIIDSA